MKYRITHTTKFNYSEAVPVCHNIVRLAPRSCRLQTRHDFRLLVHPDPHVLRERADVFGNQESYFSIEHAHRGLTVTTMSTVDVLPREPLDAESTAPWESLAQENFRAAHPKNLGVLQFYYPSPRVRPFSELQQYARKSFPKGRPILAAVQDLTARIHADFRYDPQSTTVQTPTEDVFQQRKGVCQDFAHLQIGCLRSLGLA
ncbi:MAG: transglutaminase family protein, partial [Planctomycetales bacterium]|nr:transglutaminase family protein [Planctomycetales bacterium]